MEGRNCYCFAMTQRDIAKVVSWLQSKGLTVQTREGYYP